MKEEPEFDFATVSQDTQRAIQSFNEEHEKETAVSFRPSFMCADKYFINRLQAGFNPTTCAHLFVRMGLAQRMEQFLEEHKKIVTSLKPPTYHPLFIEMLRSFKAPPNVITLLQAFTVEYVQDFSNSQRLQGKIVVDIGQVYRRTHILCGSCDSDVFESILAHTIGHELGHKLHDNCGTHLDSESFAEGVGNAFVVFCGLKNYVRQYWSQEANRIGRIASTDELARIFALTQKQTKHALLFDHITARLTLYSTYFLYLNPIPIEIVKSCIGKR